MGKIYTALKGFIVITTAGCSIAVFTGLSSSIASYILGSLIGAAALFLAFDTFGMAQALDKLNKENDRLHQSNNDYVKLNLQHETSIKNLRDENSTYVANNKKLEDEIELLISHTKQLQAAVSSLGQNNQMLQKNIINLQEQNENLKQTNTLFAINNQDLQHNIKELNQSSISLQTRIDELSSLKDQQQRQIDSLRLVQAQSKQLIQALMTAGDDFKQFQSTLTDSMNRIETTSDAMALLLEKLQVNQFKAIDANNDGSITKEELELWSKSGK